MAASLPPQTVRGGTGRRAGAARLPPGSGHPRMRVVPSCPAIHASTLLANSSHLLRDTPRCRRGCAYLGARPRVGDIGNRGLATGDWGQVTVNGRPRGRQRQSSRGRTAGLLGRPRARLRRTAGKRCHPEAAPRPRDPAAPEGRASRLPPPDPPQAGCGGGLGRGAVKAGRTTITHPHLASPLEGEGPGLEFSLRRVGIPRCAGRETHEIGLTRPRPSLESRGIPELPEMEVASAAGRATWRIVS